MNRELKFRAWDLVKNEWFCHSFYIHEEGTRIVDCNEFHRKIGTEVIIVQFTGLNDKNGKKIYEGDILWKYETKGAEIKTFCKIIYEEDRFIPKWIMSTWFNDILRNHVKELEIIGNIFENPEMLLVSQAIT
jgi:uncharacterized phage protein (TIGR01671 family)